MPLASCLQPTAPMGHTGKANGPGNLLIHSVDDSFPSHRRGTPCWKEDTWRITAQGPSVMPSFSQESQGTEATCPRPWSKLGHSDQGWLHRGQPDRDSPGSWSHRSRWVAPRKMNSHMPTTPHLFQHQERNGHLLPVCLCDLLPALWPPFPL